MKPILKFCPWIIALICIVSAGCSRRSEGTAGSGSKDDQARFEPGGVSADSEVSGYLALRIVRAHEKQKLLERAPWHDAGGDWTFLECESPRTASAKVLIGVHTRSAPKGEIPVGWGEAVLAVSEAPAAAPFIEAFAKAFHQPVPERHGDKPPGFLKIHTAVLGDRLVRNPAGGFSSGRSGRWTATKWFLSDETTGTEAEVFFNYSVADKRAEFSEKDEEYREDLVQQLVVSLRDGPLPERTPENDPALTLLGPKIVGWSRVASSNEVCQFTPAGDGILVTGSENGAHSKLFIAPVAHPADRNLLAEFDGSILVNEVVSTAQGLSLLVIETTRKNPKIFSSNDPQKLWLVDPRGKREIPPPPGVTNWFAGKRCLSPDAKFLAVMSWVKKPKQKNSRIVHLGALPSGAWRTVQLPAGSLEFIGWTGEKISGVVLTGLEFDKTQARKACLLDTGTAALSPLEAIPAALDSRRELSPDGKRTVELVEKERLIITDLASGQKHAFVFHPYDRRSAYRDSVHWAGDRYLVFQGARTALIDAGELKMSFPTEKDSGFNSVQFDSGFRHALGSKADGSYLGNIELPAATATRN